MEEKKPGTTQVSKHNNLPNLFKNNAYGYELLSYQSQKPGMHNFWSEIRNKKYMYYTEM